MGRLKKRVNDRLTTRQAFGLAAAFLILGSTPSVADWMVSLMV